MINQRAEEKRIEVARPVEFLDPNVGVGWSGYTKNLSPGGLRARLDATPPAGAWVQLMISLSEESTPRQALGKIVWSEAGRRGEGAEVGVRFARAAELDETKELDQTTPSASRDVLRAGQIATVTTCGHCLLAMIDDVVECDSRTVPSVQLRLTLVADALACDAAGQADTPQTDQEVRLSADEWRPNPVRDARVWFHRFILPTLKILWLFSKNIYSTSERAARQIWNWLPEAKRKRLTEFALRLKANDKLVRLSSLTRSFLARLSTLKRLR